VDYEATHRPCAAQAQVARRVGRIHTAGAVRDDGEMSLAYSQRVKSVLADRNRIRGDSVSPRMNALARRILSVALVGSLLGCAPGHQQPRSVAASRHPGLPADVTPPAAPYQDPATQPLGRWRDGVLELTVFGSGSCPPVPVRLHPRPPDAVEVTFSIDYGVGACTSDISPTTWILHLPASLGGSRTLAVRTRGDGVPQVELRLSRASS